MTWTRSALGAQGQSIYLDQIHCRRGFFAVDPGDRAGTRPRQSITHLDGADSAASFSGAHVVFAYRRSEASGAFLHHFVTAAMALLADHRCLYLTGVWRVRWSQRLAAMFGATGL